MIIKFKVNYKSESDEWLGWFGDDVMKLKLRSSHKTFVEDLRNFIKKDLGILEKDMNIIRCDLNSRLVEIEFPDVAWELFLSSIER